MWFCIITVFLIILIYIAKGVAKPHFEPLLPGEMQTKFFVLVNLLLSRDSRFLVYSETDTSLLLGTRILRGYTQFELNVRGDILIVRWISSINTFVVSDIEWRFNSTMDQEEMFKFICYDTDKKTNS